jgi:hypothetical protein
MKRTLVLFAAMISAPFAAKPAALVRCSGYYVTPNRPEGGFSIKVEPTVIEIVYIDYSPRALSRYARNRDGSLTFQVENGAPSTLRCDAGGATVTLAATTTFLHKPEQRIDTPRQRMRLVRYSGDIFKYAQAHHWPVGD